MMFGHESSSIPGSARCDGCGAPIDPSVCWCGSTPAQHGLFENHGFIPLGCECHRDKSRTHFDSLPDFPGDGPDALRTICVPPCFCCGGYHEFTLSFEATRRILLAGRDVESTGRYLPPTPSGDSR